MYPLNNLSIDAAISFFERKLPIAQAFHLAAGQHNAALKCVEYEVVVPSFAILGDDAFVLVDARLVFFLPGRGWALRREKKWFATQAG